LKRREILKNRNGEYSSSLIEAEVEAPEAGIVARTLDSIKRTFFSLKYADFRLIWLGGWFSNVGTWIQNVALGWLVFKLTGSSVSLGIVNFSATIPVFFLSFYAGVIADRLTKKWIVFWGNFFPMIFAFMLGYLVQSNTVNMPWIIVLSLAAGIATAFAFPAWQAMISEVVPKKDLMNAVALNSVQFHASRMLGPALAGYLVSELGMSWAFYANALTFLAVLAALVFINPSYQHESRHSSRGNWIAEVIEGFKYLKEMKSLLWYISIVGLIGVFGISFQGTLMPIYAGKVFKVGAKELGFMASANGLGGLFGALLVAWLSGRIKAERLLLLTVPMSGIGVVLVSAAPTISFSLLAFFVAGLFFLATNSTLNTLLQSSVENRFRGRVMSIFVWLFMGIAPFGALLAGWLGKAVGVRGAIAVGGLAIIAGGVFSLCRAGSCLTKEG
jgi:MFS family permease